jgi:phosphate transport system ATP-binding protein
VTALIGPSGCGKSTFLRVLNRMHEALPDALSGGTVELDGADVYGPDQRATDVRFRIGMVFQKPNPFPAMSVYDNVLSGLRFSRVRASDPDALVEEMLVRAGLWSEVRNRLRALGGELSGGQQQRLCIARALAVRPSVLRIEETIDEIAEDVTVVIVTHNMQQAQRVSRHCAFFLAEENEPGRIVEAGPTSAIFSSPVDPRTADYVHGRFG